VCRFYGNAAVATGIYRESGTNKGKPYVIRSRYTDTWIRRGGVWQCVASQSTLIRGNSCQSSVVNFDALTIHLPRATWNAISASRSAREIPPKSFLHCRHLGILVITPLYFIFNQMLKKIRARYASVVLLRFRRSCPSLAILFLVIGSNPVPSGRSCSSVSLKSLDTSFLPSSSIPTPSPYC